MKIRKDVTLAMLTMAGALVALFTLFVTIPTWFEAVVITLTAVGGLMTVLEIVKAYKASYDEETSKHTYRFPLRAFVLGTFILVAVAAIILLSLKRLYGFATIPFAVLLAALLVIALIKKIKVMQFITGALLAILIFAIVGYATSALVHSGVNLNPGVSTETATPETNAPETDAPETDAPETDAPETDAPATNAPETDAPATEQLSVHLKAYMPKTYNYGDSVKVEVTGINAHELEFEYKDLVSVKAVSDTELTITVYDDISKIANIEYTVDDNGHYVITDSAANRVYTIEVVELANTEVKDPVIENNNGQVEDKPVEDVEKPEDEYKPVVFKIHAPETMKYGEPIRVTVEGINAHNLKFGNEDFLSVVVISDTELEITLVGIVNDLGDVEFVPAAGYITITDPATGANVIIEIVE